MSVNANTVESDRINPFISGELFHSCKLDESVYLFRGVWFNLFICFNHVFKSKEKNTHMSHANGVGPDKTPRSALSDLGLYCLPMSF